MEFLPCSPKISEDVPLNSVLLSSSVPRNSIACSLDPQKYSLKFPKIPNVFQFLMISNFHNFYLAIQSRDNHPASTKCLFRLLDECCITSCILAEMSVDSVRVRPSALPPLSSKTVGRGDRNNALFLNVFLAGSSEKHTELNGSRTKNLAFALLL